MRQAQEIFRRREAGETWPKIEKETGVPERTGRRMVQHYVEDNEKFGDPWAITQEMLLLLTEAIEELAERSEAMKRYRTPAASNAQVQALKAMVEMCERRYDLLVRMGNVPKQFSHWRSNEETLAMVKSLVEVLASHRKDLTPEIVDDLMLKVSPLLEGTGAPELN